MTLNLSHSQTEFYSASPTLRLRADKLGGLGARLLGVNFVLLPFDGVCLALLCGCGLAANAAAEGCGELDGGHVASKGVAGATTAGPG